MKVAQVNEILVHQNKVIISLLARSTLGVEHITKIVTGWKKKGKAEDYLRVYNALDGSKTIADLAKIVGISPQALGQVLQKWIEDGIVYRSGSAGNSRYFGLLKLPEKIPQQRKFGGEKLKARAKKKTNHGSIPHETSTSSDNPSVIPGEVQHGEKPNSGDS